MNKTWLESKITSKHRDYQTLYYDLEMAQIAIEDVLSMNQISPDFLKEMQKANNKKHRTIDEPFKPSCEQ